MDQNVVLVEMKDGIAIVTINRPKALNALNREVFANLDRVFGELAENKEVKAIIITGAGDKAFVGGSDIGMMADLNPYESRELCESFHEIFCRIEQIPKPTIAAVNGYALGGGCELSLTCDFRIASEKAMFAFPEVGLGIIPGSGGTQRVTKLIGPSRAKQMIMSAGYFSAQNALEFGLVNKVVPAEELMNECMKMAATFTKQPALAMALAKEVINAAVDTNLKTGIKLETEAFTIAFGSEDKKQRMAAFLNKSKG